MSPFLIAVALFASEPKKPVAHVEFDDDLVVGEIDGPRDERITVRKQAKFKSLIKVRENFDDKIIRSVDQM